jgi:hypothetical protein
VRAACCTQNPSAIQEGERTVKKAVETRTERTMRVELTRNDIIRLIKDGPSFLFSPDFREDLPHSADVSVEGFYVEEADSPLVISWKTTTVEGAK